MAEDRGIENNKRARQYLRSNVYRICSWSSVVLIAASFLVPSHRNWFIYAGAAVWFGGMLPVLRIVPYRRRLDIHNRQDKRFLLFVSVYVALGLLGACLVVYFGSRR
jgi:membrane protein YdbS with pleckstrin-like domain